jgi:hypothetical protein
VSSARTFAGKPRKASARSVVTSLEVAATIGPSVLFGDAANPQCSPSVRRVGVCGELGLAYRSRSFVEPFVGVS